MHAILKRHGCSRAPRQPRAPFVRYEWPCPGDLLHMDVKRYPRFTRPGHAVTGDRTKTGAEKRGALGHDNYFHAIVDDHSRLAYGELLTDERADTTTAFVKRALAWLAQRDISARRLMTDGAWSYTHNRALRAFLDERGIRHIVTPPYTPRWNGKVERFHQTMEREWAKGLRYRNSTARNQACHTGCATTTSADPTAHSTAGHRSAALTTSPGRTASSRAVRRRPVVVHLLVREPGVYPRVALGEIALALGQVLARGPGLGLKRDLDGIEGARDLVHDLVLAAERLQERRGAPAVAVQTHAWGACTSSTHIRTSDTSQAACGAGCVACCRLCRLKCRVRCARVLYVEVARPRLGELLAVVAARRRRLSVGD